MGTTGAKLDIGLPPASVLSHLVDVHCHPTDAPTISTATMNELPITICAMASKQSDQALVHDLALAYPSKVIPAFGYHPWFSHTISTLDPPPSKHLHYRNLFFSGSLESDNEDLESIFASILPHLPNPTPLPEILDTLRTNLTSHPTALLGEVGLDRIFRIPFPSSLSSTPRRLTPFTVPIEHQLFILEAQVSLAVELRRPISLHSVKAQGATLDFLKRMRNQHGPQWDEISLDMHSCGVSPQTWREIEKHNPNIYLSLSTVINMRSPNHRALISACAPDRLLAESDYNDVGHCTERTWDMVQIIAEVRGWRIEDKGWDTVDESYEDEQEIGVVRRLEQNWRAFRQGQHKARRSRGRERRILQLDNEEDM
ncbi:TatD DNase family Scn1 [Infundibulicybe gibba]|nr:TatD DNase family Scn1 [Infundibulicybe gibba]